MKSVEEVAEMLGKLKTPAVYCCRCERMLYIAPVDDKLHEIITEDIKERHLNATHGEHRVMMWYPDFYPRAA